MKEISMAGGPGMAPPSGGSRLMGMVPWLMIGGLLYAGLFIKPEASGSAVVPPSIERRDLLLGVASVDHAQWLAGNFGKILKSQDGGASWAIQKSGTQLHLQDIDAWDAQHAVAVGNAATVLVTGDGGATWKPVAVEHSEVGSKLMRVRIGAAPGEAWAVGEMGAILHSTDFGASWAVMRPAEDVIMGDIDARNPDNIWICGEFGRLFHSTDHGASWEMVKSTSSSSLTAIAFRDAANGVTVGLDGVMLATTDGGKSWARLPDPAGGSHQHLFGVGWDEANAEWVAVGAKGVWVTISADLRRIAHGKLSPTDLSAHTKIAFLGNSAVVAGASPGLWDRKGWKSLIGK